MKRSWMLTITAALALGLTACGDDTAGTDGTDGTDDAAGTIIDDRTVVFDEGTEVGGQSTHTPDDAAVQAILTTADSHEDLAWASDHTRFVFGNEEPAGTPAARVFFACDQPALTDVAQAHELFLTASEIDGGGDCYGQAAIALDGTLIWSTTN
ncbi:MAG: hypothetical protein AAFO29_19320 [Actinomycetota bacterium]